MCWCMYYPHKTTHSLFCHCCPAGQSSCMKEKGHQKGKNQMTNYLVDTKHDTEWRRCAAVTNSQKSNTTVLSMWHSSVRPQYGMMWTHLLYLTWLWHYISTRGQHVSLHRPNPLPSTLQGQIRKPVGTDTSQAPLCSLSLALSLCLCVCVFKHIVL